MDARSDELNQLSALLDSELSEAEAAEIKISLAKSDKLKSEYEDLKALDRLLRLWDQLELKGVKASSSYEMRLFRRIHFPKDRPIFPGAFFSFPSLIFSPHKKFSS